MGDDYNESDELDDLYLTSLGYTPELRRDMTFWGEWGVNSLFPYYTGDHACVGPSSREQHASTDAL